MWKKRLAVGGLYSTNSMVLIEHFQITYLPFKVYVPPVYTLGCRIEPPTSWFNQKCMLIWVTCFYFSFVKYENAPFPRSIPGKALQPRLCLSDLFVKNAPHLYTLRLAPLLSPLPVVMYVVLKKYRAC